MLFINTAYVTNTFLLPPDLPEPSERLRAIYNQLDDLPPSNFSTLERLIFHLVRYGTQKKQLRMTYCLNIHLASIASPTFFSF